MIFHFILDSNRMSCCLQQSESPAVCHFITNNMEGKKIPNEEKINEKNFFFSCRSISITLVSAFIVSRFNCHISILHLWMSTRTRTPECLIFKSFSFIFLIWDVCFKRETNLNQNCFDDVISASVANRFFFGSENYGASFN